MGSREAGGEWEIATYNLNFDFDVKETRIAALAFRIAFHHRILIDRSPSISSDNRNSPIIEISHYQ